MVYKQACRLLLTTDSSDRAIASMVGKSHNTIAKYRETLLAAEVTWEEFKDRDDEGMRRFLHAGRERARKSFVEPDWDYVHREMARPHMNVTLLHEEYKTGLSEGAMSESEFRRRYAAFKKTLNISMRQPRRPGYAMYVDYAGTRPCITNPDTGEKTPVELFIAVVGVSRKTFATATMSQQLRDFTEAHVRSTQYFGCLTAVWTSDNLKSAVTRITKKEGHYINPTYQRCADHYDVTVLPTRARKPKDKAPVENAVRLAYWYILLHLRNRTFFSLAEINAAILERCDVLNDRPMKQRDKRSRNEIFEQEDRPVMRPLPAQPYEFSEWKIGITVPTNYHIPFEGNYYSVPYTLVGRKIDMAALHDAVQFFQCSQLVATHPRVTGRDQTVTNEDHQPAAHKAFSQDQFLASLSWAESAGRGIHAYAIEHVKRHSGARSQAALRGLKRMAAEFTSERLDAACKRALALNNITNKALESMLQSGRESKPIDTPQAANDPVSAHENVRGAHNYA